ncbi:MAG: hypothetical protein ACR2NP_20135 [Pirellulaceae bacterium]
MQKLVLRSAITLVGLLCCCPAQAQHPPENLVALVEHRAVLSLMYGNRHPAVVRVDTEISDLIAAGQHPSMQLAAHRYEQLMEQRREMGRKLGRGHRRMLVNALRIRAVSGILQDFERMPFLPPLETESSVRGGSADDDELIEDLENDMAAVALLQQLEGDWEIERVVVRGKAVRRAAAERIRVGHEMLRFDYAIEEISRVPAQYRDAFERPWRAVGYNSRLEAIEFQKMMVAPTNDWHPVLCRRFVTYRDGQLVMVCSDNPQMSPETLDPAADNYLFSCRLVSPANR